MGARLARAPGSAVIDPTELVTTPADAMESAEVLLGRSLAGATGVDCDSVWATAAQVPLAAMLYAGSARGNGEGVGWVLLALDRLVEDDNGRGSPGWLDAARHVADQPLLGNALLRTLEMDPRQRDSIVIAMRDGLSPWIQRRKGTDG